MAQYGAMCDSCWQQVYKDLCIVLTKLLMVSVKLFKAWDMALCSLMVSGTCGNQGVVQLHEMVFDFKGISTFCTRTYPSPL